MKLVKYGYNTGNMERYTPPYIIEAVREAFLGVIELDPASCAKANKIVKAKKYFTKKDDGLKQKWDARRIFLNPPYSRGVLAKFVDKFIESTGEGDDYRIREGIILVANNTEASWFQKLLKCSAKVVFLNKRVRFLDSNLKPLGSSPVQGSVIFARLGLRWPPYTNKFNEVFDKLGVIR